MDGYLYETHLHTAEASRCGVGTGAEMADFMKAKGYQGFVVTDHFFNGNSAIDRSLPWETMVEQYCRGYENAYEEGKKIGIDVYFGIEWNFHCDEFLLYGLSKEWLLKYPDMLGWSHSELFEKVNEAGGMMIQAHPFRIRGYVSRIYLYPKLVHGIEVTNSGNDPMQDRYAYHYAQYYNLPMTSGSDLHVPAEMPRGIRGIRSEKKWDSIADYIKQVKEGEGYSLLTSEDSMGMISGDKLTLPASLYMENERPSDDELLKMFTKEQLY